MLLSLAAIVSLSLPGVAVAALRASELSTAIERSLPRVEEFRFIREQAEKLGVRAYLFGGTAAGFAHYVKWDLLRSLGDRRFQPDRFDYDYTNIFRSTQDLDIVIDGSPEKARELQKLLQERFPHFQGSRQAWEVRPLRAALGDKDALLDNPDFLNQHTDSNSTGMVEVTRPRSGGALVRDIRDWDSHEPQFLRDVARGELHYYFSPLHAETARAKGGLNPPILSAIRYLTKAFQYELTLPPADLENIRKVISEFDPETASLPSYVHNWIQKNAKKLYQHAVNLEYARKQLDELGIREKLLPLAGDPRQEDSLAWWLDREPLRTRPLGTEGKTAADVWAERGIAGDPIVAHETRSFLAYESITKAHTGDPNVFISRSGAQGEAAAFGNGFYTKLGREGARNTGLTIRFRLAPTARLGTDFTMNGDYVIVHNKAALKVIPESLSFTPSQYFRFLADDHEIAASDRGIFQKLKRRIDTKMHGLSSGEYGRIRDVVEAAMREGRLNPKLIDEWYDLRAPGHDPAAFVQRLIHAPASQVPRTFAREEAILAWLRREGVDPAPVLDALVNRGESRLAGWIGLQMLELGQRTPQSTEAVIHYLADPDPDVLFIRDAAEVIRSLASKRQVNQESALFLPVPREEARALLPHLHRIAHFERGPVLTEAAVSQQEFQELFREHALEILRKSRDRAREEDPGANRARATRIQGSAEEDEVSWLLRICTETRWSVCKDFGLQTVESPNASDRAWAIELMALEGEWLAAIPHERLREAFEADTGSDFAKRTAFDFWVKQADRKAKEIGEATRGILAHVSREGTVVQESFIDDVSREYLTYGRPLQPEAAEVALARLKLKQWTDPPFTETGLDRALCKAIGDPSFSDSTREFMTAYVYKHREKLSPEALANLRQSFLTEDRYDPQFRVAQMLASRGIVDRELAPLYLSRYVQHAHGSNRTFLVENALSEALKKASSEFAFESSWFAPVMGAKLSYGDDAVTTLVRLILEQPDPTLRMQRKLIELLNGYATALNGASARLGASEANRRAANAAIRVATEGSPKDAAPAIEWLIHLVYRNGAFDRDALARTTNAVLSRRDLPAEGRAAALRLGFHFEPRASAADSVLEREARRALFEADPESTWTAVMVIFNHQLPLSAEERKRVLHLTGPVEEESPGALGTREHAIQLLAHRYSGKRWFLEAALEASRAPQRILSVRSWLHAFEQILADQSLNRADLDRVAAAIERLKPWERSYPDQYKKLLDKLGKTPARPCRRAFGLLLTRIFVHIPPAVR